MFDDSLTGTALQFTLASMLAAYPDQELAQLLIEQGAAIREHAGLGPLFGCRDLTELQSSYIELFDRGQPHVSLHETEHGRHRGLAKGHDLADIAGFYKAFGLALDEATHELVDHLAVELEFYAMLLCKQRWLADAGDETGGEIVEAARRSFLADHLGRFAGVVAGQPGVLAHPIYGPGLAWCARLVESECARLGVTPVPLDVHAGDDERDDTSCGAVRLPVLGD